MSTVTRKVIHGTTALALSSGIAAGGVVAFGSGAAHASTRNGAVCHVYGSASKVQAAIVNTACAELKKGTKYSWNGGHHKKPGKSTGSVYDQGGEYYNDTHKVGFDCSGLVRWAVYKGTGRDIGAGAYTGVEGNALRQHGWKKVSKATQPGDVVVYPGHTVIYMGAGKVVQAEGDVAGLTTQKLSTESERVTGIYRYAGKGSTPPPTKPAPPAKHHPKKVYKNVWAQAPSYTKASGGRKVGVLHTGRNYFYCQSKGSEVHFDGYRNNWWLKTDDDSGNANVWVNATHVSGGANDARIPGLRTC
ncbi:NlpC/P60 family protein [Allobranchiibius huperziae]|uniref:Cell wall-associated NlpC family hydrolase n=1 Tax=Allobranchiibius huperziae TaxID=1874116 RepID=A0A853DGX4_9MICO|nr:NlpC/P60 family protein [Allobranchiibius huperziae]NYJ74101.1 cell wall-associated NlpC family hydrolase [Allobranchiibius huperziae]